MAPTTATYSRQDILSAADYDSLPYTCSAYVVVVGGRLQNHDTYTVGIIESAIKVTKNYSGPKIQYLVGTGLMHINSGKTALEKVDFTVFGAEASVHASPWSAGYGAKVVMVGGRVSLFDLQLGAGVSSDVGIIDDSVSVKVLGTGFQLGRKMGVSVFDNSFSIDLGRLFN